MSNIIAFPVRREYHGTIHVWALDDGSFEIGHESASGNSWGSFAVFETAGEAIAAAHQLNRDQYSGVCEIAISPAIDGGRAA